MATARNFRGTQLRRYRNDRYRRILLEAGGEVCNLKLKGGGSLLLKTGTTANPDVLKLKAQV